jgi:DNA-binding transcriptional ArsR family regulator
VTAGKAARLSASLAALADDKRRAVIHALLERPRRAGDLAKTLALTPPALSRHLRILRRAGLVTEENDADDARARIYRVREPGFTPLRDWLDDVEAYWAAQLQSFKAHAESKRR